MDKNENEIMQNPELPEEPKGTIEQVEIDREMRTAYIDY